MTDELALAFAGVQTVVILVTAAFAWISIRKFRDSRGIDFVINAENSIDPLYQGLMNVSPRLIRNVYRTMYDLTGLSDDDVSALSFMQSLYHHVSRICFMLADTDLDLGLRSSARAEVMEIWIRTLATYKNHPAMRVVHASAIKHRDFNDSFLAMAANVMREA